MAICSQSNSTSNQTRPSINSDTSSLEIPIHFGTGIEEEDLIKKIREEIKTIWPIIDDLIVNAAIETKGTLIASTALN